MHQQSLLLKLFFLSASILVSVTSFQGTSSSFLKPTSNTTNKTHDDPSYLELPIYRDDYGLYYINVTWKNDSAFFHPTNYNNSSHFRETINEDDPIATGKMLLSLYTNDSFLTTCPGFIQYDCDLFECEMDELTPSRATYLYQGLEAYGNEVAIGMKSDAFSVNGYTLTYADSCGPGFPLNISGILGLGYSINALFEVNRNFSIFLSDGADGFNSALYAGTTDNSERINYDEKYSFNGGTDENWMINVDSIQVSVGNEVLPFNITLPDNYKALFDLNTDVIGLPIDVYNNVLEILLYYGLRCDASLYRPNCTFLVDIYPLPTLHLIIDRESGSMVEIKPEAYIQAFKLGDSYTYSLQLGAITQDRPSNMVVNSKYANRIILGRPFLTYYYVHFSVGANYNKHYITIHTANHKQPGFLTDWAKIIMAIAAFVFTVSLIGICIFICMKKKASKPEFEEWNQSTPIEASRQNASVLSTRFINESVLSKPLMRAAVVEKVEISANTNHHTGRTTRVWSKDRIRSSCSSDIQAHTYGKQRYKGLDEGFTADD